MLKKRLFGMMFLIIGLLLVFFFVGCDDGNGGINQTPSTADFYGTWYLRSDSGSYFTLTETEWKHGWLIDNNPNFPDNTHYLVATLSNWTTVTQSYNSDYNANGFKATAYVTEACGYNYNFTQHIGQTGELWVFLNNNGSSILWYFSPYVGNNYDGWSELHKTMPVQSNIVLGSDIILSVASLSIPNSTEVVKDSTGKIAYK